MNRRNIAPSHTTHQFLSFKDEQRDTAIAFDVFRVIGFCRYTKNRVTLSVRYVIDVRSYRCFAKVFFGRNGGEHSESKIALLLFERREVACGGETYRPLSMRVRAASAVVKRLSLACSRRKTSQSMHGVGCAEESRNNGIGLRLQRRSQRTTFASGSYLISATSIIQRSATRHRLRNTFFYTALG